MNDDLRKRIVKEAERIEEDTEHSYKGHFNAASSWSMWHLVLGCAATVLSIIAGTSLFSNMEEPWKYVAGGAGVLAGVISGILTFIKPEKKSQNHRLAGADYQELRNRTRIMREIKVVSNETKEQLIEELENIRKEQSNFSKQYPVIPKRAYKKAKEGILKGETNYKQK